MSAVDLRPVTEHELPLLTTILAELDGNSPIPMELLRARLQEMRRHPNYDCYLARRDGEIIGSLSMIVFPVLAHGLSNEAIVEAVVIRPPHRSQGHGRAMLRAAIALAKNKGAYKLALSSNLRRLDAHRFYDTMGFARHGYSFSIDTTAPS